MQGKNDEFSRGMKRRLREFIVRHYGEERGAIERFPDETGPLLTGSPSAGSAPVILGGKEWFLDDHGKLSR